MATSAPGWSAFGKRQEPRRYPLAGGVFLGLFVVLTVGLGGARLAVQDLLASAAPEEESSSPMDESEVVPQQLAGLPDKTLAQLEKAQLAAGKLTCAAHIEDAGDLIRCELVAKEAADDLDAVLDELREDEEEEDKDEAGAAAPDLSRLANRLDELAGEARAFSESGEKSGVKGPALAASAARVAALIASIPGIRRSAPDMVDGGNTSSVTSAPDAALPPVVAAVAAASPEPALEVDAGPAPTPVTTADAAPETPPEPVDAGPSAAELARQLVKPLHDALENLESAGHTRNLAADAAWRARTRLDAVSALLHKYLEAPRPEQARPRAAEFGQMVDRARGRLLRAATELERAVTASIDRFEGTMPFQAADAALDRARSDIAAVDQKVDSAP